MLLRLSEILAYLFLSTIFASAQNLSSQDQNTDSDSRKVAVHLTAPEQAWLRTHPVVRWGEDPNWPPFSQYDNHHNLVGIDADIVRLAIARAGLKVTPVRADSWS